jgi:hypothetical protein
MSYGPQLPPHLQKKNVESSESEDDNEELFGPKLPGKF